MAGIKGSKRLSEKEFKNIKLLQQAGLNATQAANITKRSPSLTNVVYKSTTLEDYKGYRREVAKSKVEAPTPVFGEDAHLILEKLKIIESCLNQLLHVIEDKEAKANLSFWKR